jgi:hypothetical protein
MNENGLFCPFLYEIYNLYSKQQINPKFLIFAELKQNLRFRPITVLNSEFIINLDGVQNLGHNIENKI